MGLDVKELRIGNYVGIEDINTQIIVVVNGMTQELIDDPYDIEVKFEGGMYSEIQLEELEPILLNHDWMKKLGFHCLHSTYYLGAIRIVNSMSGFYLAKDNNISIGIRIKNVHNLQNLYYALTGKDLVITKE